MSLKSKRILVTGAAGFIGGHLINSLLETETRITAIDIAKPRPELLSQCGESKQSAGNDAGHFL